jgi:hypothetical protein
MAGKNFDAARRQCALDGGDLVTYSSLGQQLLVENYFKSFILPAGYWVGTSRPSVGGAWANVDGSLLPQNASSDPYAHFTWLLASNVGGGRRAALCTGSCPLPCGLGGGFPDAPSTQWPSAACCTWPPCPLCSPLSSVPPRAMLQNKLFPNSHCINASRAHAYGAFLGNSSVSAEQSSVAYYATSTSDDVAYGWQAAACTQLNNYICALPFSVFTCYPPPSPPKPPPVPPVPPKPPLPPHGAPLNDEYFYCDACTKSCFRLMPTPASFHKAAEDCTTQGGSLVTYTNGSKQLAVEMYFYEAGTLPPAIYWIGANRTSKTQPFTWLDNTTIGTVPNDDPYIHWDWFYPNRRVLEYHCALARASASYQIYAGDPTKTGVSSFYKTDPALDSLAYGWDMDECTKEYAYICEIPTASFPWYPVSVPAAAAALPGLGGSACCCCGAADALNGSSCAC